MKRLITADIIHQEKAAGHTTLEVSLPECIITPEARVVASQSGIKIIETVKKNRSPWTDPSSSLAPSHLASELSKTELGAIRQRIMAQLPANHQLDDNLITQLIEKTIATQPKKIEKQPLATPQKIKCVPAHTIEMGIFSEAGPENEVGIADVITAEDGSPMAGGFMAWKDCFFPWTLNYDEIDLVLEGELHIRHEGKTIIGKANDVLFIPKGSSIEFGTPTSVRFFYVAHPANWQDCK